MYIQMSIVRDYNQFKTYVFQPNVPLGNSYTAHIDNYVRQYNIGDLTCTYMFGMKDNVTFLMYKRIDTYTVSRHDELLIKDYRDWKYHNMYITGPVDDVIVKYLVIVEFPRDLKKFQIDNVITVDNNFAISYLIDSSINTVKYDDYGKKEGRMDINLEITNLASVLGSKLIYPLVDIVYVYTKKNNNILITNDLINDRLELLLDMLSYSHRIYLIFGIRH